LPGALAVKPFSRAGSEACDRRLWSHGRAPQVPQTMSKAIPLTLTPEQERLALALSDMSQAAAAARLVNQQLDHHARRALETAISVSFARARGSTRTAAASSRPSGGQPLALTGTYTIAFWTSATRRTRTPIRQAVAAR
jgi:hypothetical protein